MSSVSKQHFIGREGKTLGREEKTEERRLSLHSSKLHWVTHPLLQLWLNATSMKHLHPTGWTEENIEAGGIRLVLRNGVIKV